MTFSLKKHLLMRRFRRYGTAACVIAAVMTLVGLLLVVFGEHWLGISFELAAIFITITLVGLMVVLREEIREILNAYFEPRRRR